nr:latent-transforming growth factor beta-binding protein 4-like [Anas platyrhynchos]
MGTRGGPGAPRPPRPVQCSSPLPGLRTQDVCCRGAGVAWGVHECQTCDANPPNPPAVGQHPCPKGFRRANGSCVDVDECQRGVSAERALHQHPGQLRLPLPRGLHPGLVPEQLHLPPGDLGGAGAMLPGAAGGALRAAHPAQHHPPDLLLQPRGQGLGAGVPALPPLRLRGVSRRSAPPAPATTTRSSDPALQHPLPGPGPAPCPPGASPCPLPSWDRRP